MVIDHPKNPPQTSYSAQQGILSSIVGRVINREWMLAKMAGTAGLQLKLMNNGVLMSCCCTKTE